MDRAELGKIMKAYIILHNMIVEDKRDSYDLAFEYEDVESSIPEPIVRRDHHVCYGAYLRRVVQIRNSELHAPLQSDLKQEIWRRHTARQGITTVIVMYFFPWFFFPNVRPYCIVMVALCIWFSHFNV